MNRLIKAGLPYGLIRLIQRREQILKEKLPKDVQTIINLNERFRNIHEGGRCFIIGTGPSLNTQDLLPLKNEIVFSLSRFYHHPLYEAIKPKYQIFSGLTLHAHVVEKPGLSYDFYKEAEDKVVSNEIFVHYGDMKFIKEYALFINHKLNYFYASDKIQNLQKKGIDLTKSIYGYSVVSELAIQIAIYMGFKNIYLLGLDHTWLKEVLNDRSYEHQFFSKNEGILGQNANSEFVAKVQSNLTLTFLISWYNEFYQGYTQLNQYCKKNGIIIMNATNGGLLDIFQRVHLKDILK